MAIYLASAKVEPHSIEADLGPVGEIDVQFEPSGPRERVHASCEKGGSDSFQPGSWVGTIDFEGEEDFTRVTAGRTRAIVSPFIDAGCGSVLIGETGGDLVEGARLIARSPSAHESLFLQANKNHQGARVHLKPRSKNGTRGWSSRAKSSATTPQPPSPSTTRCAPQNSRRPRLSPVTQPFVATPSPRTAGPATSRSTFPAAPTSHLRAKASRQPSPIGSGLKGRAATALA